MYLIDTNIHISYLLQKYEDDNETKRYREFFSTIPLEDRGIPDFVLNELETYMVHVVPARYHLNKKDREQLEELVCTYVDRVTQDCTIITPHASTVTFANTLFQRHFALGYLSFTDCLLLATAKATSFTIVSQDKRLQSVAKELSILIYE